MTYLTGVILGLLWWSGEITVQPSHTRSFYKRRSMTKVKIKKTHRTVPMSFNVLKLKPLEIKQVGFFSNLIHHTKRKVRKHF